MPESDHELIEGCLAQDKKAWDLFVARFSNLIYWSVQRTLEKSAFASRKDLADDVFQEIFKRILEHRELEKLREARNLRQFLVVMAMHAALDKIKSLRRQESRDVSLEKEFLPKDAGEAVRLADVLKDGSQDPSAQAISDEQNLAISEILERLSPKERTCVEWHYMDGKAHQDIAVILGLPVGTVSSIIQRTKEKLQTSFQRKGLK